jgi:hypothetical protein
VALIVVAQTSTRGCCGTARCSRSASLWCGDSAVCVASGDLGRSRCVGEQQGKAVDVELADGARYAGVLDCIDPDDFSVVLKSTRRLVRPRPCCCRCEDGERERERELTTLLTD